MTHGTGRAYSARMTEMTPRSAVELELKRLEKRLGELMATVDHLKDSLAAERSTLLQKNEQVRARVEAMIGRLKSMEHGA